MLLQSKEHFPEKSELWLKDLVTFLNMKLEIVAETDKYLKPENKGDCLDIVLIQINSVELSILINKTKTGLLG